MWNSMLKKLAQPTDIQVFTKSEMILFRAVVTLLAIWSISDCKFLHACGCHL